MKKTFLVLSAIIGTVCAVHAQTNVIGTTGNVLIGSTTDNNTGEKLQVTGGAGITGNLDVGNTGTSNNIYVRGNTSGMGGGAGMSFFNGVNNIGFIGNYSLNTGSSYDPRFTIQSNVSAALYLNPAGQNVIIKGATDDGVNALQVTGQATISSNLKIGGTLQSYGPGASLTNTVIGDMALSANTTGVWNVAIGMNAGRNFQTGLYNVFVGGGAASAGTGIGNYNNGIGFNALNNLSSGTYNNAFGAGAGANITSGISNTMVGDAAGGDFTTTSNNTGIGFNAGAHLTGSNWTAVGAYALKNAGTSQDGSTAVGMQALQMASGSYNTAIGIKAGYDNNTGGTLTGSYNNYLGTYAGQGNITGSYNTFIGYNSSLGSINNYVVIADGQAHNRIVVDNTGNVGIGTSTPAVPLDVIGSAQFTNTITTKGLSGLFFGDSGTYNQYSGIYPSNGANDINIKGYASSTIHFGFGNTTGANMSALEAMTIKDNGNVGIGTTSPSAKLQVYGSSGTGTMAYIGNDNNGSATADASLLLSSGGANGGSPLVHFDVSSVRGAIMGLDNGDDSKFKISAAAGFRNGDYLTILTGTNAGYVGIGTTNPGEKLAIAGNAQVSGAYPYLSLLANPWGQTVYIQAGVDAVGNTNGNYVSFLNASGRGFSFSQGGVSKMVIDPATGNVAIGTTDPKSYKLAVAGKAVAESMTVQLQGAWSDYVFKPDYNLMPLTDVKKYVDKNQHLPEIPSAAEVEKDGQNLGEMNKLLLKKVEELTLYLIEKDKQDKEKESRLQLQQQQIDELKQQITGIINTQQQKNIKVQ